MNHSDFVPKYLNGVGTEIGAYLSPVPGIQPIYVDKYLEFADVPCAADYFGEAIDLPFLDSSLDYLVASHVLEHSANPIQALAEWYRVLRPNGIAYMVVPNKKYTWDRGRDETSVSHMVDDYRAKTTDCDETHIDDFVYGVDWLEIHPDCGAADVEAEQDEHSSHYKERVQNGEEINIHFHVFTPNNIRVLIEQGSSMSDIPYKWQIEVLEDRFPNDCPNGILAILRKDGRDSLPKRFTNYWVKKINGRYPVRWRAKAFPRMQNREIQTDRSGDIN